MSFETKTILQGNKRDERSYGTPGGQGGERPLGGINGGLLLLRPSRHEFQEMMRHLDTYSGCGLGAEQDFLTDFWKNKKGIAGLPRRYNKYTRWHCWGRMECRSGAIEPGAVGPSSR